MSNDNSSLTQEVTANNLTDEQIRDLYAATGGMWIAGREFCALALGSELEAARELDDDGYYSARDDQRIAREYIADAINARAKAGAR